MSPITEDGSRRFGPERHGGVSRGPRTPTSSCSVPPPEPPPRSGRTSSTRRCSYATARGGRGSKLPPRHGGDTRGERPVPGRPGLERPAGAALAPNLDDLMAPVTAPRSATRQRRTKETAIDVAMALDGSGSVEVETGIPFFDHMLSQLGRHGGFDLTVRRRGDLARRRAPHRGGRRHRARRGAGARRSATRRASGASRPSHCPSTKRWSRWRSTSRAGPTSPTT